MDPKSGSEGSTPDRKALQLCRQVADTLQEVLADCGDPLLQELRVLSVEPAPDASRLLVSLAVDLPSPFEEAMARIQAHLDRASGHLRAEVASAVTRKKAPVLIYRLLVQPPG